LPGDEILYIFNDDNEVMGEVQSDGRIKHSAKRTGDAYYIDPVAFRTKNNAWASTDNQSERNARLALFAECHRCVGETKIESLEKLLSSCDSIDAPGAASGGGGGGGQTKGINKDMTLRRNQYISSLNNGKFKANDAKLKEYNIILNQESKRYQAASSPRKCYRKRGSSGGGGEGTGGERQSTAVSGSEKGKEIHPDEEKRLEELESVGSKRARASSPEASMSLNL
jgi:hypothetical protein